jgi:fatty acid desaturase
MATTLLAGSRTFLRHSAWDAVLVGLSVAHALALVVVPSIPVVAIGLWWNANTISHNFIHTPFFRSRELNLLYAIYLSALLGIPQSLWRDRHLQHHSGQHRAVKRTGLLAVETGVVLALWCTLAALVPTVFLGVYLPGYLAGLGLCWLQGHFEHARGTTSHYGWLYNLCFFNDGYHVEHHMRPGEHWTRLPRHARPGARQSAWPPIFRWLDAFSLEALERLVLRSTWLQRFLLFTHERALRALLTRIQPVERVTIVGGGLFPRTALILQKVLPDAALTIVDKKAEHLEIARGFLNGRVTYRHDVYDPTVRDDADLVVIPLAFVGDRDAVYRESPARSTLVHDWMWRRHAEGVPVSWLLLKRLNLVTR